MSALPSRWMTPASPHITLLSLRALGRAFRASVAESVVEGSGAARPTSASSSDGEAFGGGMAWGTHTDKAKSYIGDDSTVDAGGMIRVADVRLLKYRASIMDRSRFYRVATR